MIMTSPAELDEPQAQPVALRLWDRRDVAAPFALAAAVSIVVAGVLASAIAAPAPTRHGVWAVAFLILVLGVGQLVLGAGQALLPAAAPSARTAVAGAALFNAAGVAIMAGVVTDRLVIFDVGAVLLFVVLVLFLYDVRIPARRGWPLHLYRLVIAILLVSIPIGTWITTTH